MGPGLGFRAMDLRVERLRVKGVGFSVQCSGFESFGCRVQGVELRLEAQFPSLPQQRISQVRRSTKPHSYEALGQLGQDEPALG